MGSWWLWVHCYSGCFAIVNALWWMNIFWVCVCVCGGGCDSRYLWQWCAFNSVCIVTVDVLWLRGGVRAEGWVVTVCWNGGHVVRVLWYLVHFVISLLWYLAHFHHGCVVMADTFWSLRCCDVWCIFTISVLWWCVCWRCGYSVVVDVTVLWQWMNNC